MKVRFSHVTFYESLYALRTKYLEKPETQMQTNLENVIFAAGVTDIEKEKEWLKDNFKNIVHKVFHTLHHLYNSDESDDIDYALYIAYCYAHYKEIALSKKEYLDVIGPLYEEAEIVSEFGGDVIETYGEIHRAERVIGVELDFKDAVERCIDRSLPLSEQKEEIDNIYKLFDEKDARIVKAQNILFEQHPDLKSDVMLANSTYVYTTRAGIHISVGEVVYLIEYEDLKQTLETNQLVDAPEEKDKKISVLVRETEVFTNHYWAIRDNFVKQGIDAIVFRDFHTKNQLTVTYDDSQATLRYDDAKLYRTTGEELVAIEALAHELFNEQKKYEDVKGVAEKNAQEHFCSFLTQEQVSQYKMHHAVFVEGAEHDYIIHSKSMYNNFIRLSKNGAEIIDVLCLIPKNVKISSYDVKATFLLLVATGKEDVINKTANSFEPKTFDKEIVELVCSNSKSLICN